MAGMARMAGRRAMEPTTNTVAVKGNRMVHLSSRSAQIIDLDKETITQVDFERKTYSVMTFAEMKQMIEAMSQKMQERGGNQPQLSFSASVRESGKTKDVNGATAKEFILTMAMNASEQQQGPGGGMNITNDMWMVPEVAGYQEVKDFEQRMAAKMGTTFTPGANSMGMRPGMGGMAEMAKEMSKLKGMAVLQVTRMGSTADGKPLPAASEAPELSTQSQPQMPGAGDVAGRAAGGAANNAGERAMGRLGGAIPGGLGGFGRRRQQQQQQQDQPPDQQAGNAPPPPRGGAGGGLMMESTTEMSGFSSAPLDPSKFEVPAGFKQVKSEMGRRGPRE